MKRAFLIILTFILITCLMACSNDAQSSNTGAATDNASGDPVELTFWAGLTGADMNAMQSMVEEFNEEQSDIHVNFYSVSWAEIFSKFEISFNTPTSPDAMLMHVTDIPKYASREMLNPITEEMYDTLGIAESDYSASVWAGQRYNDVQYAVPLDYHSMGVYINNDMLTAAGLDPAKCDFTSYDGFMSICDALKDNDVHALACGANYAHSYRYWYGLLYQYGGSFSDDAYKKAEFASEAGVKALDFLNMLIDKGYAPANETDIDGDWIAGKVAMVIEGPWFTPTAVKSGLNFSTAVFPQVGGSNGVWGSSHVLTLPKYDGRSAEKTEAANTFLSWIVEHSYEWGAASGQIPANYKVSSSQEYKACDFYKYSKPFIDSAEWIHYEPLTAADSELGADNDLSPVMSAIASILTGSSDDVKGALEKAQEKATEIFKEYQ